MFSYHETFDFDSRFGFGDNQFTVFASDLGLKPGQRLDSITIRNPKTKGEVTFWLRSKNESGWYYKPEVPEISGDKTDMTYLSLFVFND